MVTALIIYASIAYTAMLIIILLMMVMTNKPSREDKLVGFLLVLFAPITLPFFALWIIFSNPGS